jgi:hypothetical protein
MHVSLPSFVSIVPAFPLSQLSHNANLAATPKSQQTDPYCVQESLKALGKPKPQETVKIRTHKLRLHARLHNRHPPRVLADRLHVIPQTH